jgi:hypothetical protein
LSNQVPTPDIYGAHSYSPTAIYPDAELVIWMRSENSELAYNNIFLIQSCSPRIGPAMLFQSLPCSMNCLLLFTGILDLAQTPGVIFQAQRFSKEQNGELSTTN